MRALSVLSLFCLTATAFGQTLPSAAGTPVTPTMPVVIDRALTQRQLETLAQQLAVVQSQLETDPAQVGPALAQLRATQRELDRLTRNITSAPPAHVSTLAPPPPPPPAPWVKTAAPASAQPMTDARLATLLEAIRNQSFSNEQLGVLRQAAEGNLFTVAQAQAILPLFSFSADRIAALQALAPRLTDRGNAFKLCDSFAFSTDKDQARKILAR